MKFNPVEGELFPRERTDRQDEVNSRFLQFFANAPKNCCVPPKECFYWFCMYLRTNSDYLPIQHLLAVFY